MTGASPWRVWRVRLEGPFPERSGIGRARGGIKPAGGMSSTGWRRPGVFRLPLGPGSAIVYMNGHFGEDSAVGNTFARRILLHLTPTVICLLCLATGSVADDEVHWSGSLVYDVATNVFLGEGERMQLEIEVSVVYEQLQFIAVGDSYQAGYDLSAILRDTAGNQAAGDIWTVYSEPEAYAQTQRLSRFITSRHELSIAPGEYHLSVLLRDRHSSREGTVEKELHVPDLGFGSLQMSDVTFVRSEGLIFSGDEVATSLATGREGWEAYPKRRYDETDERALFSYEIYRGPDDSGDVREEWYVIDADGLVQLRSRGVMAVKGTVVRLGTVPLEGLRVGEYALSIRLEDERTQRVAFGEAKFSVVGSFFASREEYEERVEQLEYVATPDERERLRSAPPEDWVRLWNEFWKEFDPTPNTERNERMLEYFRRVDYADSHFLGPFGGWRSDMGRIYIKFGHPSEIERHYFDPDAHPYEIWYYYSLGEEFIFVDERGFGEYRLVYPLDQGY